MASVGMVIDMTYCETCGHYEVCKDKAERWVNCPDYIEPVKHGRNENQKFHEVDEFRCSECGLHLEDWTRYVHDEDSDDVYAKEYGFKYCPECGAKIGD